MCTEIQSSVTILVQKLGYPIILNILLGIRMLVTRYKINIRVTTYQKKNV